MGFCIMRMAKIKSNRDVVMTLQHNNRERMPGNADPERTKNNQVFGGSTLEAMVRHNERMPEKIRSNAVLAVELVLTASPEFAGNWTNYLMACDNWARGVFGPDNLLHVAHHFDETTPHSHIIFTPLKDGKLNAKSFIGGSRDRMAELQEDFYQTVGKEFGLERGRPREETRARHTHHTLAGRSAALDERERGLGGREELIGQQEKALEKREVLIAQVEKDFNRLMGMKRSDVQGLKTMVENWDRATPASLRVIARDIEQSGAATVGEYRKIRESQRQQEQQQQSTYRR